MKNRMALGFKKTMTLKKGELEERKRTAAEE